MRISDWSSDVCSSDLAGAAGRIGLNQPDRMDDQRDHGPPGERDQADVGPAGQRRDEQDRDVRIAARGDPAEPAVEVFPSMASPAEILEEQTLAHPTENKTRHPRHTAPTQTPHP